MARCSRGVAAERCVCVCVCNGFGRLGERLFLQEARLSEGFEESCAWKDGGRPAAERRRHSVASEEVPMGSDDG